MLWLDLSDADWVIVIGDLIAASLPSSGAPWTGSTRTTCVRVPVRLILPHSSLFVSPAAAARAFQRRSLPQLWGARVRRGGRSFNRRRRRGSRDARRR